MRALLLFALLASPASLDQLKSQETFCTVEIRGGVAVRAIVTCDGPIFVDEALEKANQIAARSHLGQFMMSGYESVDKHNPSRGWRLWLVSI